MTTIINKYLLFSVALLAANLLFAQKEIPAPTNFLVNDYAGMLSRQEVVELGNKLSKYALETSIQIVILTEKSLEGESEFDYAQRLAESWGIGSKENESGILILVAQQERKIRIQTGYGTEGFLPDALAKRIIENTISPAFRQGRYYEGLDRATDIIMSLGRGEGYEGVKGGSKDANGIPVGVIIFIFLFIMILVIAVTSSSGEDDDDDGGYWRGGKYDMDDRRPRRRRGGGWIIFPGGGSWTNTGGSGGGGSSGGGWGGFGGGGFGGFGGGGFGGGGASGGW